MITTWATSQKKMKKKNHWIVVNFVLPIDPNMLSLGMLYTTWALHSCVLQVTIDWSIDEKTN